MKRLSILTLLQVNKPTFSPTELNIANYVLANPEEVFGLSIHELSRKTYVSSATITRFCHKLQLDGYREFQSFLAFDLAAENEEKKSLSNELVPEDSTATIMRKITQRNIQSIEMAENLNAPEAYENAAQMIKSASQVCLLGMGATYLSSRDFFHKLIRIQKTCTSSNDWHVQLVQAKSLNEGDLVVALSYSGNTPEVLLAAKAAKEVGANVLAITRACHKTELARIADECLFVAPFDPVGRTSAAASFMAQLSVLDILYATYMSMEAKSGARKIAAPLEDNQDEFFL